MSERTMTQEIKETLEIIREALDHYSPLELRIMLDAAISVMDATSEYNHEAVLKAIFREVVKSGEEVLLAETEE